MLDLAGISEISDLSGANVMNLVDLVLATDPAAIRKYFVKS